MAIGYACLTMGVAGTDMKSCTLRGASEEKLMEITRHNITALDRIIDYNIKNNIRLYRISSDLIPFGSSPVNQTGWWQHFGGMLRSIGRKIMDSGMRVSLHPGQYTVLNAEKSDVVERAVDDLAYHARILDSLGLDATHKIVLHIGGAYQDKKASAERFLENFRGLDPGITRRMVIENDDRIFTIRDVLDIGTRLGIPVVFDNLHHEVNPCDGEKNEFAWIERCRNTWQERDGLQKIHYAQQAGQKRKGSHSDSIDIERFMDFYRELNRDDIDIMLEVKDKNLSCIKCIHCTAGSLGKGELEKEWDRYKFTILERSPAIHAELSKMLRDKDPLSPLTFYSLIQQGLESTGDMNSHLAALRQVWECINQEATEKEWQAFHHRLERLQLQREGIKTIKSFLRRLAEKYGLDHLINSYYFFL